jgi:hypothetical protein
MERFDESDTCPQLHELTSDAEVAAFASIEACPSLASICWIGTPSLASVVA